MKLQCHPLAFQMVAKFLRDTHMSLKHLTLTSLFHQPQVL